MDIIFLGTSCMVPTKERNLFSVFVSHEREGILIDCGEGTQRQFKQANLNLTKITKIFLTHWHGDHILGLPGLIQSLGAMQYTGKLTLYGPKGTLKFFENMKKSFFFDIRIELEINEITKNGVFYKDNVLEIEARILDHGIPCLGYRINERDRRKIDVAKIKKIGIPEGPLLGMLQNNKTIEYKGKTVKPEEVTKLVEGKSAAIVVDTVMCNNALKLAKDADLLVSESTYTSDLEEKGEQYGHMTARQAATLANLSNVKMLVLTHFSQRYKTTDVILEDAQKIFQNVKCAYDLMKVKV